MTEPKTIVERLTAVMEDVREVRKTGQNQAQGFSFRGIDAVVNAVGPALRKHGVVVMPTVNDANYGTVEVGKNRSRMRECTLSVTYTFYGPAGDSVAATVWGEALDSGDKATAKAHSVAMRTALLQALCIPTDDPDPDSTSYERSAAPEPMTATQHEAIAAKLAELGEDEDKQVRAWWKAQRYPKVDHLSHDQAGHVLEKLAQVSKPKPPPPPPPPVEAES